MAAGAAPPTSTSKGHRYGGHQANFSMSSLSAASDVDRGENLFGLDEGNESSASLGLGVAPGVDGFEGGQSEQSTPVVPRKGMRWVREANGTMSSPRDPLPG
jgi:hypothetical protein